MSNLIINGLLEQIERFLEKWSEGMQEAGYLAFTTAKREDCILSLKGFLDPLREHLEGRESVPSFSELIHEKKHWADFLVEEMSRHRSRGVTAEMFLGCFKTFLHAVEEVILGMEASPEAKLEAVGWIRRCADACETLFIGHWEVLTRRELDRTLSSTNRKLTLEKNKYENILAATSDLVLVTDDRGIVVEANASASAFWGGNTLAGTPFWSALDLEGQTLEEVIRYYPLNESHEITLGDDLYFKFQIIPLSLVSLASSGYMILLSNVSCLVLQRQSLENVVHRRTAALVHYEKRFSALFQAAGEAILLVDTDLKIFEVNQRSGVVFGALPEELQGKYCWQLCRSGESVTLDEVIRRLDEDEIWTGELVGRRLNGGDFPMVVTVNRVDLDSRSLFQLLVRDITQQKAFEERLQQEKQQQEEMNITLRTLMKSIDHERKELERTIAQKVETVLLPTLEKIESASSAPVRNEFLSLVRHQLVNLASSGSLERDAGLLRLTPTEMKICLFIQAGSKTKDIAEAMNLSMDTVQTHRKSIRNKLGLKGRDINLYTFLMSPRSTEAPFPEVRTG